MKNLCGYHVTVELMALIYLHKLHVESVARCKLQSLKVVCQRENPMYDTEVIYFSLIPLSFPRVSGSVLRAFR